MLENNYTIAVEELETALSEVNLFKVMNDLETISLRLGYLNQNFNKFCYGENEEEAEAQRASLEDLEDSFQNIKYNLENQTYALLQNMDVMKRGGTEAE